MLAAMNAQDAVNSRLKGSLLRHFAGHMVWRENNFGESRAFENIVTHPAIAIRVSGAARGGVYHNLASRLARLRIKMNGPALQLKTAMHGVEKGAEREFDTGLRGLQVELNFWRGQRVRRQRRRAQRRQTKL